MRNRRFRIPIRAVRPLLLCRQPNRRRRSLQLQLSTLWNRTRTARTGARRIRTRRDQEKRERAAPHYGRRHLKDQRKLGVCRPAEGQGDFRRPRREWKAAVPEPETRSREFQQCGR